LSNHSNHDTNAFEGVIAQSPTPRIAPSPTRPIAHSPSRPSRIFTWLSRISRFLLAALFLFTAGAKLIIAKAFAENVGQLLTSSGINHERWSWPVTIAVIGIEIVIAILLLLPRTIRFGAACAALLLSGFAAYALYYVYVLHGEPLECGCFGGIIASQLGVSTALRNLALLIPALLVWRGYRRSEPTLHPAEVVA
jgi:Methylamine utilisation protein MauE.